MRISDWSSDVCSSDLKAYKIQPTDPLRPIIPDNARPSRLTAAAGTKLAGASSSNKVIIFFDESALQPTYKMSFVLSSRTQYYWIRLSPIVQYSSLLAPEKAWTLFQFQCG